MYSKALHLHQETRGKDMHSMIIDCSSTSSIVKKKKVGAPGDEATSHNHATFKNLSPYKIEGPGDEA